LMLRYRHVFGWFEVDDSISVSPLFVGEDDELRAEFLCPDFAAEAAMIEGVEMGGYVCEKGFGEASYEQIIEADAVLYFCDGVEGRGF
jgi:hypothetical protein